MIISAKYKLNPTKVQIQLFNNNLNNCRALYNAALEERIETYKKKKISISKYEQYNQLPLIKKDLPYISETYSDVLQETLDRVDKAYKSFFKGNGFPKWAKKKFYNSFTYKRHFTISNNKIKLPKIGEVKFFNSKDISNENLKTATIIRENNNWFISITYEISEKPLLIDNNHAIGIDAGIKIHSYLSNNTFFEKDNHLKNSSKKLRILNRKLSRQKKNSKNRNKTVIQLQKLYCKITNQRKDFNHKLSTVITNTYSAVYVEDLKIKSLSNKSDLQKEFADNAFYSFRLMLDYKCKIRGKVFKAVPPFYTSQTCPKCKKIHIENRKTQSEFACVNCNYTANADYVAAQNILAKGISYFTQSKTIV